MVSSSISKDAPGSSALADALLSNVMHPFKFKALLLGRHYIALSDNVTSFHKTMLFLCQAVLPMIRRNTALVPHNETQLWYTVMKLQVL